jgi:hypothetical protein
MMIDFAGKIFDVYTIKARLIPVLFVILPILLVFAALFPDNITSSVEVIASSVSFIVFLSAASNFVREKGKSIEGRLYKEWGGKPTICLLRCSSSQNEFKLASWHKKITEITGKEAPSKDEEATNPDASDKFYDSYIKILLSKTRDVSLVFQENCNYGFRRNLLGIKTFGIITSLIGMFLNAALIANIIGLANVRKEYQEHGSMQELFNQILSKVIDSSDYEENDWLQTLSTHLKHADMAIISLGLFGSVLLFIFWTACVNSNWVKLAANTFANRLLEASENVK